MCQLKKASKSNFFLNGHAWLNVFLASFNTNESDFTYVSRFIFITMLPGEPITLVMA